MRVHGARKREKHVRRTHELAVAEIEVLDGRDVEVAVRVADKNGHYDPLETQTRRANAKALAG
jgi:hypothetical protein